MTNPYEPENNITEVLQSSVFYEKNTHYAVTINPEDKFQYFGTPERFKKFRSLMYELFLSLTQQHIAYKFVIELSEPRNNKYGSGPRYHVHGWILFKSNRSIWQFLDNTFYRWTRIGHVDIDTIKDLVDWETYMTKQSHIFKSVNTVLSSMDLELANSLKKGKVIRKTVGLSNAEEDRELSSDDLSSPSI